MSELGQVLRSARLEKKISLDDLQESTKIRKAYLEAIENGNYRMLPGNFYVRAFIKSYAEAVGLDPGEVLRLYQNVIPAPEVEQPVVEPVRAKRISRNPEKIGKWVSLVMVISFIVLIMGIIYYFFNINYDGRTDADSDGAQRLTDKRLSALPDTDGSGISPSSAEDGSAVSSPPVPEEPEPPKTEVKLLRSEWGVDYYTVSNATELDIQMSVTGDACWVQVKQMADGKEKVLDQKTYNNSETAAWKSTDPVRIRFGRANAVELNVNGTIVPVGNEPNVKNIHIELNSSV